VLNTVLLIPDGIGVRNFVLGSFLEELRRRGPVTVLHDLPAGVADNPELRGVPGVEWRRLPAYKEDLLTFELRQALLFGHFFWGNTFGMRCMLARKRPSGSWKNRAARQAALVLARLAATPAGLQMLDRQHEARVRRSGAAREAARLLEELRPDVIFCSHQRPTIVAPFVAAAREAGIPTATFIFSWDNLTSKARMPIRFDHFLVWSDQMRSELLQFYPDVSRDRVHLVGTPQFDPYYDRELLWSREEFCERIGANPARPIICYSGGDLETSPDDPAYVEALAELIEQGEIEGNPQLLVRPTPVDNGHRYRPVLQRHPGVLFSPPEWYHPEGDQWNWVVPSPADIRLLVNTVYYSAINVNLASTMTLDFAIWDRPVVNIALDVIDPPRWGYPAKEYYYRFEHYLPVIELGAVRLACTRTELRDHINAYLRDPSLEREERRKLVELEVSPPLGNSARRVVDALRQIAAGSASLVTH
jgi:hypothetical protein